MYRLIAIVVLLSIVYWFIKRAFSLPRGKQTDSLAEEMVRDPVCGCYVPKSQSFSISYREKKLFFCSPECFQKYQSTHSLPKG